MELTHYEIVLVNLHPTIGSDMQKTKPAVNLSPNEMNKYLNTVVIAPMTSSLKSYPTRVEVNHNKTKGWIVLDKIRTIDRQRITKMLDKLTDKYIKKVKNILKETFVD